MCGILAILGCYDKTVTKRSRCLELSRRLRHRGPDWSGLFVDEAAGVYLAHERLAIIDPASGDQPLFNETKEIVVAVNGEIYNHEALKAGMKAHQYNTQSDCEVIAHLYEEIGEEVVVKLDGMFSFVLVDLRDKSFIAARDPLGITPLYLGWGSDGTFQLTLFVKFVTIVCRLAAFLQLFPARICSCHVFIFNIGIDLAGSVWFASEMKALKDDCERFVTFPPGHIYSSKEGGLRRYYNPPWFNESIPAEPYDPLILRHAFEKSVIKRLMTDVPFGVLLSGGLDSSLVAAVAQRHLAGSKAAKQWGNKLHSFCVGLEGSPDLKAAREVADYIGTVHKEFHFTVQVRSFSHVLDIFRMHLFKDEFCA
ncbi:hypothetical protein KC19_VG081000 [Ceratodon purpureus]|uniref:Glutamine amidotransferase type-2 domain-containing protein n=1 Tax=Ceratodon purpureus TaxID=3225 RepID=A0A8T0HN82_CERPU|nr:hypothetical protein KC19_VG081000 [Ceratodon purpureus]